LFSKFNPQSEIYELNSGKKIRLSSDTSRILKEAKRLSKLTHGAFDVTLGQAGGEIDLGAIAKGYAVESARKVLLKKGAESGMINLRSSIAVFGPKTRKVGIQHPRDRDRLIGIVELKNGQSLATSGDYERGKHVIDPRTGKPAQDCQGVTVIGKNAAETDALSTAVFVLGPKSGMKLVESLHEIEALIIDRNGKIISSSGLALAKP
ncbi:MAG: FAD:protein FMN transferase, partial [Candidatus Margulisiibacteriota bacterium]